MAVSRVRPVGHWLDWPNTTYGVVTGAELDAFDTDIYNLRGAVFNVKDRAYGAVGDGVTDDTAAIQAAVTAAITLSSAGTLWFPPGVYKISSAINIPFAGGWRIYGAGLGSVTIKQMTDNTPIFKIANNLTHSWHIDGFLFTYANAQASTNTAACPIYFVGGSVTVYEFFNFVISDCYFDKCCDCIGADATTGFSVWGGDFRNLRTSNSVSRSLVTLSTAIASGQPNNSLKNIYVLADAMVGPIISIRSGENTSIDNFEINEANLGPTLLFDESQGSYNIGSMKLENGTYTTAGTKRFFDITNSIVNIQRLLLATLTCSGGGSFLVFDFPGGFSNIGQVRCAELELGVDNVVSAGSLFVANSDNVSGSVWIGHISGSFNTRMALSNLGGGYGGVWVDSYMNGRLSANKGDANYTFAVGDANIVSYETALTAARTVTLPRPDTGASLFNGLTVYVARSGGGAFDLSVVYAPSATLLAKIPSGSTGVIAFTYRAAGGGGAWVQTQYL